MIINYLFQIKLGYLFIAIIMWFVVMKCDFEDSKICGYLQPKYVDDFDWTRNNRSTASSNTGPGADHTYGTINGILFCLILLSLHLGYFCIYSTDKIAI